MSNGGDPNGVAAVNCIARTALTEQGEILEIQLFFDDEGGECDPEDAITCVATNGTLFWSIDLRGFNTVASKN
jgi:hypothetical protein